MSLQDYLDKIKLQHIALLLLIVPAIIVVHPLYLPMPISPLTTQFVKVINELEPGNTALFGFEMNINDWNGARDLYKGFLEYLGERHIKLVMAGFSLDWPTVVTAIESYVNFGKLGYVYGTDYVFLPYAAGEETGIAAVAATIPGTFSTDIKGNPIGSLQIITQHPNLVSYDLVIARWSIGTYADMYIRQWSTVAYQNNIPMIVLGSYSYVSYVYGKNIVGCLERGAEFEYLVNKPGEEIISGDAANVGIFISLILVTLANIAAFQKRRSAKISTPVGSVKGDKT